MRKKDKDGKFNPMDLSSLSDEERKEFEELDQLPAGSVYMVLTPRDKNNFALKIHDATKGEFYSSVHVLVKGLVGTMEKSFDEVMCLGEEIMEEEFGSPEKPTYEVKDNVISVDFSKEKTLH